MCTNTTNIINNTTCHIDLNINQRELHLNNSTNSSLSNDYTIGDIMYFPHPEEMLEPWVNNSYFFPILFTYIVTFIVGVTGNLVVIWIMTG